MKELLLYVFGFFMLFNLIGCMATISANELSVQGVPKDTWYAGIQKDPETGEQKVVTQFDSEKTLLAVIDVARKVIDGGTGVPVLGTIEVAGTTAGNLVQSLLRMLDPGKPVSDG